MIQVNSVKQLERIPPHDLAAEKAVLAAMIQEPLAAEFAVSAITPQDFYLPVHRAAFGVLARMLTENTPLDILTVSAELQRRGLFSLQDDWLTRICIDAPNAAFVENHCQILRECAATREIEQACQRGLTNLRGVRSRGALELSESLERALADIRARHGDEAADTLSISDLLAMDTEHDPDCLLGRRWLCRGGSCLIVGQTGFGKSSIAMQAAITWALGQSFFGITPTQPLNSLIIQAENDRGDMAEEVKGVINGCNWAGQIAEINQRVKLCRESAACGEEFIKQLKRLVERHKPDLIWIDPLYSFLGGDVSDQGYTSRWLRNLLNPVLQNSGACAMLIHHATKPPKGVGEKGYSGHDLSYLGAGSSELANWARAVLTLRANDDTYVLTAAKRGRRAGLVTADGENGLPTQEVFLRHGERGICWERADAPQSAEDAIADSQEFEILEELQKQPLRYTEFHQMIQRIMGVRERRARTKISELSRRNKIVNIAGHYSVR